MEKILSAYERGWLEAAIDGEGSLGLYFGHLKTSPRPRVNARLQIANSDERFVKKAQEIMGVGTIAHSKATQRRKTVYRLSVYSSKLRPILPQLSLVVKRRQQVLLEEAMSLLGKRYGRLGHAGGICRPLWKDRRLEEIKAELHRLNGGQVRPSTLLGLVATSTRQEEER